MCRIKGTLRRRIWIRMGDAVLVELWGFQSEDHGDIIGRYVESQKNWLRKKGYLPDWLQ